MSDVKPEWMPEGSTLRRVGTTPDGLGRWVTDDETLPMIGGPMHGSLFTAEIGTVCWIRPKGASGEYRRSGSGWVWSETEAGR